MLVLSQTSTKRTAMRVPDLAINASGRDDTSDCGISDPQWRRQVLGPVDVADHARIADGNLDETLLVRGEQRLRSFVALQREQLGAVFLTDADRVTPPRAKVRRHQSRAARERIAHRGDRRAAHERHVAERDEVAVRLPCLPYRAGEARAHAFGGVLAHDDFTPLVLQRRGQWVACRPHDGDYAGNLELQMPRRLHGDRYAVRQLV